MSSVTGRIKEIKQPKGGYVNPKLFKSVNCNDDKQLYERTKENVHATIVGLAVDYLTRAVITHKPLDAFKISIFGAEIVNEREKAIEYAKNITNLTRQSIINSCKLSGYDVAYRAGRAGKDFYKPIETIEPNDETIENIEIMVNRGIRFFDEYGPVTKEGFTFEYAGYTDTVHSGDGDFLTSDTLWDFKVSVAEPTKNHTLQLLMYYLMGKHSKKEEFKLIQNLGIFNPRLNKVYLLNILDISSNIFNEVEKDIICYN